MLEIPVFTEQSSDFVQIIDLETVTTTIRLTWNTRVEYWFMAVSTDNSNKEGIKLVKNYLLLDQLKATFADLKGDFAVLKKSNTTEEEFTYKNFGEVWSLFYLTEEEVEEFKEENGI